MGLFSPQNSGHFFGRALNFKGLYVVRDCTCDHFRIFYGIVIRLVPWSEGSRIADLNQLHDLILYPQKIFIMTLVIFNGQDIEII
ncbi:hypothetical protein SDC9_150321 [bioreactor metagenome]|uniref:Uncharacterized protein n=1 Tax=bioreactor metagenome TaxID=1076179 RepID=A0A645EM52_9ZZZZ